VSRDFRAVLGGSAVAAARAVNYENAGTVEFIVDTATGEYYFMEMNTRLQVEHPVTEAVMGLDLVELQLRVAAGESLAINSGMKQEDLEPRGHAFEARLYAENPSNGFLPAGGSVLRWCLPPGSTMFEFPEVVAAAANNVHKCSQDSTSCDIRVDSGVRQGDVVGVNYDPMIAKVLARGPDRTTALRALGDALGALQAGGLPTNAEFLRRITLNEEFQAGPVDTGFIQRHEAELLAPIPVDTAIIGLAVASYLALTNQNCSSPSPSPWTIPDAFRVNHRHREVLEFVHAGSGTQMAASVVRDETSMTVTVGVMGQGEPPAALAPSCL